MLTFALMFALACETTTESGETTPEPKAHGISAAPVPVDQIEPDPEVLAMLEPFAQQVAARANRVVGELTGPLKRGKPESTMGVFVADAIRDGMVEHVGKDIAVCFTNTGGLRRDLPAGPVTEGLVIELMPFDNGIVVFEMSGTTLRGLMNQIAARGDPVSGVSYMREGRKARDLKVAGAQVDDDKTYAVCTSDYIFEGGGGYDFGGAEKVTYTGVLLRDLILRGFERREGPIKPPTLGKITEG